MSSFPSYDNHRQPVQPPTVKMAQERTGIIVGTNSGHVRAYSISPTVIPSPCRLVFSERSFSSESIRAEGSPSNHRQSIQQPSRESITTVVLRKRSRQEKEHSNNRRELRRSKISRLIRRAWRKKIKHNHQHEPPAQPRTTNEQYRWPKDQTVPGIDMAENGS